MDHQTIRSKLLENTLALEICNGYSITGLFQEKKEYLNCLKTSGHKSEKCRQFSKKYLECRMQK